MSGAFKKFSSWPWNPYWSTSDCSYLPVWESTRLQPTCLNCVLTIFPLPHPFCHPLLKHYLPSSSSTLMFVAPKCGWTVREVSFCAWLIPLDMKAPFFHLRCYKWQGFRFLCESNAICWLCRWVPFFFNTQPLTLTYVDPIVGLLWLLLQ